MSSSSGIPLAVKKTSAAAELLTPPMSPLSPRRASSNRSLMGAAFDKIKSVGGGVGGAKKSPTPMTISLPSEVVHVSHVAFDQKALSYSGLPQEWQDAGGDAFVQFGVSITSCPRVVVPGYTERIPAVLVQLRDELEKHGGLLVEGVFRVAPSADTQKAYKAEVDSGTFKGCRTREDSACMAALLKEWLRTMPIRLLNLLPVESIREGVSDVDLELPEPNLSVFNWLIDLLAETVEYEATNRMNAKAIAVVVATNLYSHAPDAVPNDIVRETNGVIRIVEVNVTKRLLLRKKTVRATS